MTVDDIAKIYGKRLSTAKNKDEEINKIIEDINKLRYDESGELISTEYKIQILEYLLQFKQNKGSNGYIEISEGDNKNYLELIKMTLQYLKKGK